VAWVAAVAALPLLRRWAARLAQVKEEGVAGTMDLFQAVEKLLEDATQIRKSSVLGLVLRRVFLQFDKLTFRHIVQGHFLFRFQFSDVAPEIQLTPFLI
jgi:hypothetical protein